MNYKDKKQKIFDAMKMQKAFFNPKKTPNNELFFQHIFNEPEGKFEFYFHIKNKKCRLKEGKIDSPIIEIITDYDSWRKIGGDYLPGKQAIKEGKLKIIGGFFNFIFKYKKIFSGNINWEIPKDVYIGNNKTDKKIKNVLILSGSPRCEKGATHFLVEHLIKGMKNAGAKIDILFPSKMKIKPCIGCFACWLKKEIKCIHNDDMNIFWKKYFQSDLIVWATPIYLYHCTTCMKILMDRLFARVDPYILIHKGQEVHGRKKEHVPDYILFATSGFLDKKVIEPLRLTFKEFSSRTGSKLISEIIRPSVMPMISEDYYDIKKDQILSALTKAGEEIITNKKISNKTKKIIEQKLMKIPGFISATHAAMDKFLEKKILKYLEYKL